MGNAAAMAMTTLQPAEIEKWLHGLRPMLPCEAVTALAEEVKRKQMDGSHFSALVASRATPKLGDAVRPTHMAKIRQCWNANQRSSSAPHAGFKGTRPMGDTGKEPRPPPSNDLDSSTGSRRAPSINVGASQPQRFEPPARRTFGVGYGRNSGTNTGNTLRVSPQLLTPSRDKAPSSPGSGGPPSPEMALGDAWPSSPPRKGRRPASVPRLDLSSLQHDAGKRVSVGALNSHEWKEPMRPVHHLSKVNPVVQGFACASAEDQQRISEFYGYRDEGFVSTMMGLKTDQIRPRLYLGNMADAAYWPLLKSLSITHVLNCAVEAQKAPPPYESHGITYMLLPLHDSVEQTQLLVRSRFRVLREATLFLHSALRKVQSDKQRGTVLVHCVQGLSRGAALVCAYLMEYESLGMDRALMEMRSRHTGCLTSHHWQAFLHKFNAELLRGF